MFKKIFIEITNRCNLACDFCPASRRALTDLAPARFAALLHQLTPFTKHLSLHVLGEPLLHSHFEQILALCHEQNMQVNLTTNGTLLGEQAQVLLASQALRQVNVSLHSISACSSGFDPDLYLLEVLRFSRLAAARGIYISLRIWNRSAAWVEKGERWRADILIQLEKFFGISEPLSDIGVPGQGQKLAEKIYLSQKDLFAWPKLSGPDLGGEGTCRGLRDHLAILVDGTVVPCCLDGEGNIPLGNVFQESFGEIIAGTRASLIRKGFQERRVVDDLCRRCSYRLRFAANRPLVPEVVGAEG